MPELKRSLGLGSLLALSVSSMVGTGLFFGPAIAASYAGTTSIFAWLIISVIAMYVAACFSELAAMMPKAGGIYEFTKQTYGRFVSFIVGWMAWLIENMMTTLLIVAAINYLLPLQVPLLYKIGLTLFFIVALNVIAYIGIDASSVLVSVLTVISIIVILATVVPGAFLIETSNFVPIFTHPFKMVFVALFFIAETFFGYEAVTYLAEETKNPEKNIPKALMWGTFIVVIFALSITIVLLGAFGWEKVAGASAPLLMLTERFMGHFADYFEGIGIYLILIGSAATAVVSSPRLLLAMARDKLFLKQFDKVHKKFKTPYKAIIFQAVVSVITIFLAYGSYKVLLSILVPMSFTLYIFPLLSIPILRKKKRYAPRPFKVWFGNIGPIVVALLFFAIIVGWAIVEHDALRILRLSFAFIGFGIPIYFLLQMYYNPKAIVKMRDILASAVLLTEGFNFPIKRRRETLHMLGNIKGKKVLEFGCSVGTLTMHLAEAVGKKGKVYAIDSSRSQTGICAARAKKKGHRHVLVVYDEHHHRRVHPNIPKVDAVVSMGMLSYVQDVHNVLRDMNKLLKVGDRIVFVDYDNMFYVIPNVEWIENDTKLKRLFHAAGFHISVVRKQGLLWKYIYIYGVKYKDIK